jgi:hypothetical protein
VAFESGRRWHVLFPFTVHRQPLSVYRARYPPPPKAK